MNAKHLFAFLVCITSQALVRDSFMREKVGKDVNRNQLKVMALK
jgi:hypothetical protein